VAAQHNSPGYKIVGDVPQEWRLSRAAFEQLIDGGELELAQMVELSGEPWLLVVIDDKAHLARFPGADGHEAEFRFLGSLDGGWYSESLRLDEDGDLVTLEMRFEHPELPGGALTVDAQNESAVRAVAAIRKRCRRWAGSGIRVWGPRTF
jgi:hypothetical protein